MNAKLDTRIIAAPYGIIMNPVDDSIWGSTDEVEVPGQIFRIDRGSNPPETCITERYMVPKELGYRPRGIDVDRNGVIWTALAGSAHMASFDRRKCKVRGGPATANGRHCDEGWTFYKQPGPSFKGTNIGSEFNYYNWVDQFNTLGLGANTPIANGSGSDSLLALDPATGRWVVMRVPYPMGFHSRGLDGRIDDPNDRVEGARGLRDLRRRRDVAHRGRAEGEEQFDQVPDSTRSARAVERRPCRARRHPREGAMRQRSDRASFWEACGTGRGTRRRRPCPAAGRNTGRT